MAWWDSVPLAEPQARTANWWDQVPLADTNDQADPIVEKAAIPAEEDSWMDTIQSGLGYANRTGAIGVRRFREGASNLLGLPVDLVNTTPVLANLLPGVEGVGPITEKPFMGSEFIDEALGGFGAIGEPAPPTDVFQRGLGRMSEEVGAAAVPVAGLVSAGARLGTQAVRQLPGLARLFLEPAAVNPARFVGKEAAAATAAGMGAATANEVYPDSQVADVIGAIAGAGSYGVATHVGSKAADIFNAVRGSPNYADDIVRESVTDALAQGAGLQPPPGGAINTEDLVAQILGGPRIAETIPGYRESLADRTGNAGLAAMEYSRQSGPNAGNFTQRRAENTAAIDEAIGRSEPGGQPGAFRTALEDVRDERIIEANRAARQAQDIAAAAVAPVTPGSAPAERGNVVRTALEDAREAARERTSAAYDAADVSGRQVDPTGLTAALDEVTQGLTVVERGLAPQGVLDQVTALGRVEDGVPAPITLKTATDLRSELQRLQRAALADPKAERGGRNAARVLERYVGAVDNYINANLALEEQAALQTARGTKFEEAESFTRAGDPVAAALSSYEGGNPRMRDERVAGSFVDPQSMTRLFAQADTPQVRAAIRDELLSRADTTTPEGIQQFTTTYAEQLNQFPGLRDQLDAAVKARVGEATAKSAEAGLVADIGREGKGVVAKYLQYGDENAEKAMKAVLANKQPGKAIDDLLTFVDDDPEAVEGARKVFWEIMQKSSRSRGETTATVGGVQPWMPKALKRFIDDPAKQAVAERLWRDQPEHLENIRTIADALQNVDIRSRAKAPNTSGTAQGVNPLLTPEAAQSRFYAYRSGRISGSFLLTSIGAVTARRAVRKAQSAAIERMLDEALNNPEVAAMLLKENNPANRAAMRRKAKGWFGNEASTILEMFEDEEDPTVRAAMEQDR